MTNTKGRRQEAMRRKRGTKRIPKRLSLDPAITSEADLLAQSQGQYLSDFVEEALRREIKRRKRLQTK